MKYASKNPVSNTLIKSFAFASKDQILSKIARSASAFAKYQQTSIDERKILMYKVAEVMEKRKEEVVQTLSLEVGKPLVQAGVEHNSAVTSFREFADLAPEALETREYHNAGLKRALSVYQPLGPIMTIMPGNFPLFLPVRNLVPTMLAGNTVIYRPAPHVPQISLLLEDIMNEGGFKGGEFQTVFPSNDHTETIISHPDIRGVAFTGTQTTGRYIASLAGKHIKKCQLELGGNDAFVVLDDADLQVAVERASKQRLWNAGQTCVSSKRFIIHKDIYDAFTKKLAEVVSGYKLGDPMNEDVTLGPLGREELLVRLKDQVRAAIKGGARVVYGDEKQIDKTGEGNFFSPIFLEGMDKSNPSYEEEFFGPVFILFKAESEEEAIKLANDSNSGLGGCVISTNLERAERVALQIESGMVGINGGMPRNSYLPFGGVKNSGYGRECGEQGLRYFTNMKTIAVL